MAAPNPELAVTNPQRLRPAPLPSPVFFGNMSVWQCDLNAHRLLPPDVAAIHGLVPGNYVDAPERRTLLIHPDDVAGLTGAVADVIEKRGVLAHEFRAISPEGSIHFLCSHGKVFCDDSGEATILFGATVDITERKRATRQLQLKFGQLQLLFELAGAVSRAQKPSEIYRLAVEGLVNAVGADRSSVLIFDSDGVMRFKAWIGLSDEYRAALERHTPWRRGARDAQPITFADVMGEPSLSIYQEVFAKEGIRAVAFIPLLGNGGLIGKFMLYYNAPHEFQSEELQVTQTIATHVGFAAERRQAEIALRDSERRLALAQSGARLGVWDCDLRTNATAIFGDYARLHGLAADHPPLAHEEWLELVHPDDREMVQARMQETLERTQLWDTEFRVVWPDGSVHWLLGKGKVFHDDCGVPVRMVGVSLDITDRKQAAAALRESEERFRNMADTAPVMIWVSGSDKLCTFFNKRCLEFTGHSMEQKIGDGWIAGVHPEDRERFLAKYSSSFDARQEFDTVFRLRRADGEYRWVLTTGAPRFASGGVFAGYIGSCIDITELRRTQEEALARQKLEGLGVLAGGIAHDFNNLLGGILAEAELVDADLAAGLSPDEGIARIKTVAIRGAEIVRQLMIYAGEDQDSVVEPVDLSRLAAEMLELMKVSISKHAVLKINLEENLPAVWGNAPQIRQVLMNLVTNASEAIGEKEGVIQVTTSRVTGGKVSGSNNGAHLPAGDYVRLEVSDCGCGLTDEAKTKIFDPFFTTKFAGRGLGLAVVQGIVRAHGGAINVVSTPGQGATFQVLLSCTSGKPSEAENTVTPGGAGQSNARIGITGTVLVVEDEEVLRLGVSKALRKRGFSVMEARDGSVAMDLMRTHQDDIDVILLDVTLPGTSSREVFEEARRMRANPKVVVSSAYDRKTVDASFPGLLITQFIRKPFRLDDLAGTLRDALAS